MPSLPPSIACALLVFTLGMSAGSTALAQEKPAVAENVRRFLDLEKPKLERGTERYYLVHTLEQALQAHRQGNYGIGSVVLVKWKGEVHEFRDHNAMVTGLRLRDHAEARALDRAAVKWNLLKGRKVDEMRDVRLGEGTQADDAYKADTQYLTALPDGLHVYGTLEPCPMCMVMMINIGVKSSVSLSSDGKLAKVDGLLVSDGAAMAAEGKLKTAPQVWQGIVEGQGLEFTIHKQDPELGKLADQLFIDSRGRIDSALGKD